jgi:hypothetical protein
MLLAAMLAMMLAAAAPAFAQAVGGNIQYVDCDQIQAAATGQYNFGNQDVASALSQQLGVSQNQVLACLRSVAAGRNISVGTASPAAKAPKAAKTAVATAAPKAAKTARAAAAAAPTPTAAAAPTAAPTAAPAARAPAAALPPTGGAPVLAIGAGALLLAGGLLARRLIR